MKTLWLGVRLVCVVMFVMTVAVSATYNDPSEEVRTYMLGIIDEALLDATEDIPDYLEPDRSRLYFRNSMSLQTLRDAVKNAKIRKDTSECFTTYPPIIFVGEQSIGCREFFYCKYPDDTWWILSVDDKYLRLIRYYAYSIREDGEGFGVSLENGDP